MLRLSRTLSYLTQDELSKKLGFNRSNYARSELKGIISAENFLKVIFELDVPLKILVEAKKEYLKNKSRKYNMDIVRDVLGDEEMKAIDEAYDKAYGIKGD